MAQRDRSPRLTFWRQLAGVLLVIPGIYVVAFVVDRWAFRHLERIILSIAYGEFRYAAGLHIVNKRMQLSDGTTLSPPLQFLLIAGSFAVMLIAILLTVLVAMWVYGEGFPFLNPGLAAGAPLRKRPVAEPLAAETGFLQTSRHFANLLEAQVRFRVDHALLGAGPRPSQTAVFGYLEEGVLRPGTLLPLTTRDGGVLHARVISIESSDGPIAEAHASPRILALIIEGHHPGLPRAATESRMV